MYLSKLYHFNLKTIVIGIIIFLYEERSLNDIWLVYTYIFIFLSHSLNFNYRITMNHYVFKVYMEDMIRSGVSRIRIFRQLSNRSGCI